MCIGSSAGSVGSAVCGVAEGLIAGLADGLAAGLAGGLGVAAGVGAGFVWPSCCAKTICVCTAIIIAAHKRAYFIKSLLGGPLWAAPARSPTRGDHEGPPRQLISSCFLLFFRFGFDLAAVTALGVVLSFVLHVAGIRTTSRVLLAAVVFHLA